MSEGPRKDLPMPHHAQSFVSPGSTEEPPGAFDRWQGSRAAQSHEHTFSRILRIHGVQDFASRFVRDVEPLPVEPGEF